MTELTPSAIRAALIKGRKENAAEVVEASPPGEKTHTAEEKKAMWAKAHRRPASNVERPNIEGPTAPVAAISPPRTANIGDNIDRAALWAKAMKEARRHPLPDCEGD